MKTRLISFLQKYLAPSILGPITVHSEIRQVYSHQQEISIIKKLLVRISEKCSNIQGVIEWLILK